MWKKITIRLSKTIATFSMCDRIPKLCKIDHGFNVHGVCSRNALLVFNNELNKKKKPLQNIFGNKYFQIFNKGGIALRVTIRYSRSFYLDAIWFSFTFVIVLFIVKLPICLPTTRTLFSAKSI